MWSYQRPSHAPMRPARRTRRTTHNTCGGSLLRTQLCRPILPWWTWSRTRWTGGLRSGHQGQSVPPPIPSGVQGGLGGHLPEIQHAAAFLSVCRETFQLWIGNPEAQEIVLHLPQLWTAGFHEGNIGIIQMNHKLQEEGENEKEVEWLFVDSCLFEFVCFF